LKARWNRQENGAAPTKDFLSAMFGWMMPPGANRLKLSKMNLGGVATFFGDASQSKATLFI
jgi:hypothetical protein